MNEKTQPEIKKEDIIEPVPEYQVDLDKLEKQEHNWVQRGIVVSCEGAGHPNHRHFLYKRSS